jgi:Fe-S-cluster containining protein
MCPLNSNGLCQLYKFRPMICRLHGIPHELKKTGAEPVRHPGCLDGTPLFNTTAYYKFDRTPLYAEMAKLEMEYRLSTDNQTRIKQTIAEILGSSE